MSRIFRHRKSRQKWLIERSYFPASKFILRFRWLKMAAEIRVAPMSPVASTSASGGAFRGAASDAKPELVIIILQKLTR
jgi:hypothetical protein